ncbi:MAG: hypothetical protein WAS07_07110 [Micropruina sp.]|nr:hypothetical protein [Micropruina sp.]
MKILSRGLLIIGLLVLVGGGVMLAKNAIDINMLHAVAVSMRSAGYVNPLNEVLITAALASVGGLLTGIGIAMPKGPKTPKTPAAGQSHL